MAQPGTNAPGERAGEATRERILAAAGAVFAACGYRGATLREITDRAGVNLASVHYHFGSKQDLYLDVARRQFDELGQRLAEEDAAQLPPTEAEPSRAALEAQLQTRVHAMLDLLLEPPGHHGLLMQRELCDPSEALPVIVRQFIEPLRRDMQRVVARLAPGLAHDDVDRCTRSLIGQVYFYITHRPALLLLMGREDYPRGFSRSIAEHVTRFSLGGIAAVAAATGSPGGATP